MVEGENLALNIFEDFEKQESWQSYTTLLFADLSKIESDKKKDAENFNNKVRTNLSMKK